VNIYSFFIAYSKNVDVSDQETEVRLIVSCMKVNSLVLSAYSLESEVITVQIGAEKAGLDSTMLNKRLSPSSTAWPS
jgi:hypothetical protein